MQNPLYSLICVISICCFEFVNSKPFTSDCDNVFLQTVHGCETDFGQLTQMLNILNEEPKLASPRLSLKQGYNGYIPGYIYR